MAHAIQRGSRKPPAKAKAPWRRRLMNWWRGQDSAQGGTAPKPAAPAKPRPATKSPGQSAPTGGWSNGRIALAQQVWGQGFAGPGGEKAVLELVEPLGLNAEMHILDLGAGLGGGARLVTRHFSAKATGFEPDPMLAKAGMTLSTMSGLASMAPIGSFNLNYSEQRTYDRLISKEFLFAVKNKEGLIHAVQKALTDDGQIHFTDYVLPARGHRSKALKSWMEEDPARPRPWAAENYVDLLKTLKFDIRAQDHITEESRKTISRTWAIYLAGLQHSKPDRAAMIEILDEFAIWARRVKLMESGDLRVCRIHAGKRPPPKAAPKKPPGKPTIKLLSNW